MCTHGAQFSSYTRLDCEYSCRHWSNIDADVALQDYVRDFLAGFEENKKSVPVELDVRYGDGAESCINIWGEVKDKLFVAFHGGYWQDGDRRALSCMVAPLVKNGIAVACVGYDLARPDRQLADIEADCAKAVEFLLARYPHTRLHLGGHSAGVHCAFKAATRLRNPRIVSLLFFAGLFDITDLPNTYIGRGIGMTPETARSSSCRIEELTGLEGIKIFFILGECESPHVLRQMADMKERMRQQGFKVYGGEPIPGVHHFSLVNGLADENSDQCKRVVQFIHAA